MQRENSLFYKSLKIILDINSKVIVFKKENFLKESYLINLKNLQCW